MRAFRLTNLGPGWVVSTPAGGGPYTRRLGTVAEAGECHLRALRQACVLHRIRAVGGRADRGELSHHGQGRRARGERRQPAGTGGGRACLRSRRGSDQSRIPARAAPRIAATRRYDGSGSAGVSALWSGTYKGNRSSFAADVWPGDALLLNAPSTRSELPGGGAHSQAELCARVILTWWPMISRLPTTGPTIWQSRPQIQCLPTRGCRRLFLPPCSPI